MYILYLDWLKFKQESINKSLNIQYVEYPIIYYLWMNDGVTTYLCNITKGTSDAIDFENNYKADANKPIINAVNVNSGIIHSIIKLSPDTLNTQILWSGNNTPYRAGMWLKVVDYIIPTGYLYSPYMMQYSAGNSSSLFRATEEIKMGSLNTNTNVFADNNSYTSPRFASYLELRLLQDCNTNRTITITYTNQDGVTGRTATISLFGSGSSQDKANHTYIIPLQNNDTGVSDITNISTNSIGTGNLEIYGCNDIFRDSADASTIVYTDSLPSGVSIIPEEKIIALHITSAQTVAVARYVALSGQLSLK